MPKASTGHAYSVFCPPSVSQLRADARLSRSVYRWLHEKHGTVFLADTVGSVEFGALPGHHTLLNPNLAHLSADFLGNASAVISFRLAPILFARDRGIAHVLVTRDKHTRQQAAAQGVRALTSLVELRELFTHSLFSPALRKTPPPAYDPRPGLTICVMSDWEYVSQLVGFIENLRIVEPVTPRFFVLTFQKGIQTFLSERFKGLDLNFVDLSELWNSKERETINRLPLARQAYASKARLMRLALQTTNTALFYADLDLHFFTPMSALSREFENKSLLLFPHWNDTLRDSHRYGLFNAGLVGVRSGAEIFLDWWAQRCLVDGVHEERDQFYVDQGYLDLAPLYFDPAIYKGKRHNLGPWCLRSFGLKPDSEVGSYHASQPDPFGFFEVKSLWDQMACLAGPFSEKAQGGLAKTVYVQQSLHWDRLNRLYRWTHYLPYRLGLAPFWPSPRWQHRLLRGPSSGLLRLFSKRQNFFAREWRQTEWIAWQTQHLRTLRPLSERFRESFSRAHLGYSRLETRMET